MECLFAPAPKHFYCISFRHLKWNFPAHHDIPVNGPNGICSRVTLYTSIHFLDTQLDMSRTLTLTSLIFAKSDMQHICRKNTVCNVANCIVTATQYNVHAISIPTFMPVHFIPAIFPFPALHFVTIFLLELPFLHAYEQYKSDKWLSHAYLIITSFCDD